LSVAAISAFTSYQLDKVDGYPFCPNPLKFVHKSKLGTHINHQEELLNDIIQTAEKLDGNWNPMGKATKNGFQTRGNLFSEKGDSFSVLNEILTKEIQTYYNKFKDSDSKFIEYWPNDIILEGWFVRLEKTGYQSPHIHPDGWLSGVVYLELTEPDCSDQGAIEFGISGWSLPIIRDNLPSLLINPTVGDIILFPSSLFHRTIPINSLGSRCIISFDLKPDTQIDPI
jgi:hypothetical protein